MDNTKLRSAKNMTKITERLRPYFEIMDSKAVLDLFYAKKK